MRIVRRLVHAVVIVLTLVIGAAAAAIIVSQTAWFKNWVRGFIVAQANNYLNGTLSIERLGGNLFFGIEMENIGVSMDGKQVVAVKDLGLDYNVFQMFAKGLSVDSIRLNKPVIYLRREGDTWSLSKLVKKQEQEADRSGPARPVSIDEIGVSDGELVIDGPVGTSGVEVPKKFDHLDAKLAFKYEPVRYSIEISHVSFRGSDPELALNALSGGVAVHDDAIHVQKLALRTAESSISIDGAVQNYLTKPVFNLQVSSDKLSLPEIARLVPALAGVKLQPQFQVKVDGPLDRLGVEMSVRSSAGEAYGKIVADVEAPGQSVASDLSIRHLNLAPILNDPKQQSDITANARVNVHGEALSNVNSLKGTLTVNSPRIVAAGYTAGPIDAKANVDGRRVALDARAAAYGATATTVGTVMLPDTTRKDAKAQPIAFDLHGQARKVDLRKMPRELKIPPADTDVNADYRVSGSVTTGKNPTRDVKGDLKFLPSTVAGAQIAGGSTAAFTMNGNDIGYAADATVNNVDLQRIGEAFDVPALKTDRYKSTINAQVTANGRGTTPKEMDLTAKGALTDTSIMDGTIPQLNFDATLARDTAHVKANGSFAGFDPAVASGRKDLEGKVGGNLDVDATVSNVSEGVTPDSVEARANVNLDPSMVGGLEIARAKIDGDYHNAAGDIRAFEIVGRDVNVQASGAIALNDDGQSNLKLHADSPSLDTIGKLVNQPLTGIAKIDATVTGNKRELQATGNLTGDGVKYGDNGALTASSDFTAKIPNLDAANASVTAKTHATFVTLGGQNINDLAATTTYTQQNVEFDVTARQPERSLTATGALTLHPDHQEVHLKSLGLTSQGVQWQTAPNNEATINYGGDAVDVKNLKLVNGDQTIDAEGTFGRPGESLKVTLNQIDVATVDALLIRPPQLSGRLNANAAITGTKDAPEVKADFRIAQGGFRQFKYDSFAGTANYTTRGVTVDSRLEQNPTTWLTARGFLPSALFGNGDKNDQVDFHVDSSAIDLGVVQGFTNALTNVKGTLHAKIDVTGTADDPRPSGEVTIQKAAFKVEPTEVNYTDLNGRVDLQPDRVHIGAISVLDNHFNALVISGDLAIRERQLGGVSIYVHADDFKVIDNDMGNVRISTDLALTGELRAPRVEGDLGVNTGQINLDPILAQVGPSAYATKPTEYATTPTSDPGQQPAAPVAFDALAMNVHLTVPDDLVVKASDLTVPGSPTSLGATNMTLGGDLRAQKDPGKPLQLVGDVNTIRGFYEFQGRRFTLLRDGRVRFEGDPTEPVLDIKAERVIQAVTARVNVRGTVKQPEIELSSVPPLEQADILALIVFNQNLNELGEGQQTSLVARAQSMATGAVANQIAKSVGNALNLNEFEINMAPERGGGPEVTVGQQVGPNLYVKVEQGIGDASQTNIIVEYELTKWLRLRTNVLQGSTTQTQLFQRMEGSGVDLLFFFSY